MSTPGPTPIDEYIAAQPETVRPILEELRATVLRVAPDATESIAYQIPTFSLRGKHLVHFAAWSSFISCYPVPDGDDAFNEEVVRYRKGKGTLRFSLREPIPYDFVERQVQFLIAGRHLPPKE